MKLVVLGSDLTETVTQMIIGECHSTFIVFAYVYYVSHCFGVGLRPYNNFGPRLVLGKKKRHDDLMVFANNVIMNTSCT